MEIDQQTVDAAPVDQELSVSLQLPLNILSITKSAQLQNGLKHGDYGRYRQYCARRLRSLYKAVKFLHGKGRYQKKKLDVPQVTDTRHLQIVLMSAERAWSHAMQLKQEGQNDTEAAAKKRHTALRRLRKASFWASEVARIASSVCDNRSQVEADAYASWMTGNLLMEKESDWQRALAAFSRARTLFSELAKVSDSESQALCGQMVEELDTTLRYCNHRIELAGGKAPDPAAMLALAGAVGDGPSGLLQSKLASLAAEAQTVQAASTSSFQWRTIKAAVTQERVRVPLHTAAEAAAALEGAMDTDGADVSGHLEQVLSQHDKLINLYNEARAATRSAIKAAQTGAAAGSSAAAGKADTDVGDLDELTKLETALSGRILEVSLARGQVAVADAAARFEAGLARHAAGKPATASKGKDRPAKPEDLVRLTTTLAQLSSELEELASHLGGRQGEALAAAAAAQGAAYVAWRVYYLGHVSLAAGGRWAEAAGLFRRAAERAAAAQEAIQELPRSESAAWSALPGLQQLSSAATAYLLVACAEAAVEGAAGAEEATKGLEGLGLARTEKQASAAVYLPDALDTWASFAGSGSGKGAAVYQGPYSLAPVRPRPIMLDSAAGALAYPDVSHRMKRRKTAQTTATGTFARLFGGWGSSS